MLLVFLVFLFFSFFTATILSSSLKTLSLMRLPKSDCDGGGASRIVREGEDGDLWGEGKGRV